MILVVHSSHRSIVLTDEGVLRGAKLSVRMFTILSRVSVKGATYPPQVICNNIVLFLFTKDGAKLTSNTSSSLQQKHTITDDYCLIRLDFSNLRLKSETWYKWRWMLPICCLRWEGLFWLPSIEGLIVLHEVNNSPLDPLGEGQQKLLVRTSLRHS